MLYSLAGALVSTRAALFNVGVRNTKHSGKSRVSRAG
jgi:hypothetical protein